jgi:hypothetical protein
MRSRAATRRPDLAPFAQTIFAFVVPEGMIRFRWRWREVLSSTGYVQALVCPNCRCPEDENDVWGMLWSSERPGYVRCTVCGCDIFGDTFNPDAYYKPTPGGAHGHPDADSEDHPFVRPGSCRADR